MGIITQTIAGGSYTWDIEAHKTFFTVAEVTLDPVFDFYAAVDARRASGPEDNTLYGVAFRKQDETNFYAFFVSDFGDFELIHYDEGKWTTLIDWTRTDAIHPGQWNRVAVQAVGPDFTLFVNDQQVSQFFDDSIPQGGLRVVASVLDEAQAVVAFDNFEVRQPAAPPATK